MGNILTVTGIIETETEERERKIPLSQEFLLLYDFGFETVYRRNL